MEVTLAGTRKQAMNKIQYKKRNQSRAPLMGAGRKGGGWGSAGGGAQVRACVRPHNLGPETPRWPEPAARGGVIGASPVPCPFPSPSFV